MVLMVVATLLHVTASMKAVSSIEYLLACGASRTQQNEDGNTPFMCLEQVLQRKRLQYRNGMNMAPEEIDIIPKSVHDLAHGSESHGLTSLKDGFLPNAGNAEDHGRDRRGDQLHDGDLYLQ
jgi:hypothetical protein